MELELAAVIGFSGSVIQGLILHPDNQHLIFPLGSTIVVRHILQRTQQFLRGHDQNVSCLAVSRSGNLLASGQQTHMGFQALAIIWDFISLTPLQNIKLHKVLIQSLHFSPSEKYLATLGGQDDNMLVVWDVATGKGQCGASIGHEPGSEVKFYNQSDNRLITVQDQVVRLWEADYVQKKLNSTKVNLGNMRRQILNVLVHPSDSLAYLGTKTGDILEINLDMAMYKKCGPLRRLFSQGINCMALLQNGDILVGTGSGTVAKLAFQNFQVKSESEILGPVTSISLTSDGTHFFLGTSQCNMYLVDSADLTPELRTTCHYQKINDVAFPSSYSEVFATCSINDIRVWNARNRQELLRIQVPNLECFCIGFTPDGKTIISGWNDGKIRAFLPQSGKLLYVINDSHRHGVTAISSSSNSLELISGGMQGQVRIWKIGRQTQTMQASLKEHRGRVWAIQINRSNQLAVSASSDGSCIVWDLRTQTRQIALFQSTMFKQVLFHPDQSQLLTAGSDRKITYWDTFDGQAIRTLDGSEDNQINTLAITLEGDHFASAGADSLVKIWNYDEGLTMFEGVGHSSGVTKILFSPDQRSLISVGEEGAIFIWSVPEDLRHQVMDSQIVKRGNLGVIFGKGFERIENF